MKRHIALEGDRKWFSNHLVELQSEALGAVDKISAFYGACALSGGVAYQIDVIHNQNKFTEAMVVLYVQEESKWMVMPLRDDGFVGNYDQDRWVVAQKQDIIGEYKLGSNVIAHDYTAEFVFTDPELSNGEAIFVPAKSSRIPDMFDMLNVINNTRMHFASFDHNHDSLNLKSDVDAVIDEFYVIGDGNRKIINFGLRSGLEYEQYSFEGGIIKRRIATVSAPGEPYLWGSWLEVSSPTKIITISRSDHISTINYSARAYSHNGLLTININATIERESNVNEALLTLIGIEPLYEVKLTQPLFNSNYTSVIYRDLYISKSDGHTIIRMDTDVLRDFKFDLNLTLAIKM